MIENRIDLANELGLRRLRRHEVISAESFFSVAEFKKGSASRVTGRVSRSKYITEQRFSLLGLPVWRVIRVKINVQTFSSLNFETSLFTYNYFLIAALFPV